VDCRQRLLFLDTVLLGLSVGVLGLAFLLLHRSEELVHLQCAQTSDLLPAIAWQLILQSVEVNALRGRGLVQIRFTRPLTEIAEKPDQSTPHQALRGLELAVKRKRAEPFDGPRGGVLQGFGGGERCAPARIVLQEPDRSQL
jgi:hypothetical protein